MDATKEPGEEARSSPKNRFQVSSLLPIVAMCMSVFSLYVSEMVRRDVARMDVIKTAYGLFHDLAQIQLQYPLTAHLFTATNQTYDLNVVQIKASLADLSQQERARMLLQERAVAHYFFTTYEEAYYLWMQATNGGDRRREELAHDDLAYFNAALCSNPRLLWYWDFNGGKMDRTFAEDLRTYYKENVPESCQAAKDPAGPFGAPTR
jgi:hypothetical protein